MSVPSSKMRGAFAAPDSSWPGASVLPARPRMGSAAAQLLLIVPHVIVPENVLMMRNTVENKDDWACTSPHRPVRRRAK